MRALNLALVVILAGCSGGVEGTTGGSGSSGSGSSSGSTGTGSTASSTSGGTLGSGSTGSGSSTSSSGSSSGSTGAGWLLPDGGDPYVAEVVQFDAGANGGFHEDQLPAIVAGPPHGAGASQGSLDVLSLGAGGVVVVRMGQEIVDGPGTDFTVFENALRSGETTFGEPGMVGVSDDGLSFTDFPCEPDAGVVATCAGLRPVFASPTNGISALDPSVSGGDPFDLADLGLSRARYVRIRDLGLGPPPQVSPTAGFDLDAIAVVHAGP